MSDLRARFRSLDRIAVPDAWDDVLERAETPATQATPLGPRTGLPAWATRGDRRTVVAALVLAALLLALIASIALVGRQPRPVLPPLSQPILFQTLDSKPSAGGLYAIPLDGGTPVLVSAGYGYRVHVSPDGQHVLSVRGDDTVVIARTNGSAERAVAPAGPGQRNWEDVWSPDSQSAAFVTGPDGASESLAIESPEGERPGRSIALPPGETFEVFWSPDNRNLLLRMNRNGPKPQAVLLVDTATGDVVEIGHEMEILVGPSWSPDGRHFVLPVVPDGTTVADITLVDTTTLETTALVTGVKAYDVAWAPDGSSIRWSTSLPSPIWNDSAGPDRTAITSVEVDGGQPETLATVEGDAPIWSPDGTHITWFTADAADGTTGSQWVMALADAKPRRLTTNVARSDGLLPQWSTDGAWIAFGRGALERVQGSGSIWVIRIEGTDEHLLVDAGFQPDLGSVDW